MLDDIFLVQPESGAGSGQSCKRLKKCFESTINANDLSAFVFKRQQPQDGTRVQAGSPMVNGSGDAVSGIAGRHGVRETQEDRPKHEQQRGTVQACEPQATNKAPRAPAAKKTPAPKKTMAKTPAETSKQTPQTSSQKTVKPESVQSMLQPEAIPPYGLPVRHEDAPHFFGGRKRSVLLSFAYNPAPKEPSPDTTAPCLHSRWGGGSAPVPPAAPVHASRTEPASARVIKPPSSARVMEAPPSRPNTQGSSIVSSPKEKPVAAPDKSASGPAREPRRLKKACKPACKPAEPSNEADALLDSLHPLRDGQPEAGRLSRRARGTVNYNELADGDSESEGEVRSLSAALTHASRLPCLI
jgi:hypothetical protein